MASGTPKRRPTASRGGLAPTAEIGGRPGRGASPSRERFRHSFSIIFRGRCGLSGRGAFDGAHYLEAFLAPHVLELEHADALIPESKRKFCRNQGLVRKNELIGSRSAPEPVGPDGKALASLLSATELLFIGLRPAPAPTRSVAYALAAVTREPTLRRVERASASGAARARTFGASARGAEVRRVSLRSMPNVGRWRQQRRNRRFQRLAVRGSLPRQQARLRTSRAELIDPRPRS